MILPFVALVLFASPSPEETVSTPASSPAAEVSPTPLETPGPTPSPLPTPEWYSAHFQGTVAAQGHPAFHAAYSGPNSLSNKQEEATSVVSDLPLALRLWPGAHAVVQPEVDGGLGLSSTLGVADFPSGEVYRVGNPSPSTIFGRAYLQQIIDLGGGQSIQEPGPYLVAGPHPDDSLTITAGRINGPDTFDNVPVSNDPHSRFTSWGLWGSAAYDYAADTRGYTYGLTADLSRGSWSLRAGIMAEPLSANAMQMDFDFARSNALTLEGEHRFQLAGKAGAVRVLIFNNTARMGSYEQVVANPVLYGNDVTNTRQYGRQKYGAAGSVNQDFGNGLAAFLRASWDNGVTESWAFTAVDRSVALGAVQSGKPWRRPDDAVGAAVVVSGLSPIHEKYLAGGGLDFLIGDGALNYGPEMLGEVFYQALMTPNISCAVVYQPIVNPGYNRDRGPVNVYMFRTQTHF